MDREDYLEIIHLRIDRVTEDLRAIQRALNCAAMEVPNDPELMEAMSRPPEIESLRTLEIGGRPDAPFPLVLSAGDGQRK